MNIRQTLVDTLNAGITLRCQFKVAAKQWYSDISLTKLDDYWFNGFVSKDFSDAESAIDFFGTLVFNEKNMKWFFGYLEKIQSDSFSVEDIEYMDDAEIDKLYADFVQNHFAKECPHASEFKNQEAIELIEIMKQEFIDFMKENEEGDDE
jgi:hypothetical protein